MGIPRKQKPSPAEGGFLFQLDPERPEECVTAYAGIPLFLQAARSLDVPGRVKQHLQIKPRQRGFDEAGYVESFLVLNALGGECLKDFERLREDEGLSPLGGGSPHRETRDRRRRASRRLPPLLALAIPKAWRQTEDYCRNPRADPPHAGEEQAFID